MGRFTGRVADGGTNKGLYVLSGPRADDTTWKQRVLRAEEQQNVLSVGDAPPDQQL